MNNSQRFETQQQRWQPPPELARLRPRLVRFTAAGKLAAGAVVALLAGVLASGLWLYIVATRDRARYESLQKEGIFTAAEVVELGRTRGNNTRYFVVYRYTADGNIYSRRATFQRRDWRKLKLETGSLLQVRYLPSKPDFSWIPGREPKGVPLWTVPVVPAGLALAVWLIVYHLRKQWRLLSEGRPALARVTRSERFHHSHSSGHRVHYEFRVLSGATRSGRCETTKKPPPVGATMIILYDAENPQDQARYPLSLVRAG